MAGKRIEGKMLLVGFDEKYFDCQSSASLTITRNTTETDACKPINGDVDEAGWTETTSSSRTWTISMSGAVFNEVATGATSTNNLGIIEKMLNGDGQVEVVYRTNSALGAGYMYTGTAIVTSYTENADVEGNASFDVEFQGTGALVMTPITEGSLQRLDDEG